MSYTLQLLFITFCKKKFVLLADMNLVRDNIQFQTFYESFLFEHLVKKLISLKRDTPTGIYHNITNISKRFIKSMALEIGISNSHKMIMTVFHCWFSILHYNHGHCQGIIMKFFGGNCFRNTSKLHLLMVFVFCLVSLSCFIASFNKI